MTLTHTVSSLAHDAAKSASELGSQAAEFGSKVAEIGADTKSTVTSAASNLAHAIAQKVPGVKPKRRTPWRMIVAVCVGVAGLSVFMKGRRKPSNAPTASYAPPKAATPAGKAPAETPKGASTTNGTPTQDADVDKAAKH